MLLQYLLDRCSHHPVVANTACYPIIGNAVTWHGSAKEIQMTLSRTKSCLSNLQSILQMTVLLLVPGVPEFSYAVKDHLFSGRQFIWTIVSHARGAWLKRCLHAEVNFVIFFPFLSPSLSCCPWIGLWAGGGDLGVVIERLPLRKYCLQSALALRMWLASQPASGLQGITKKTVRSTWATCLASSSCYIWDRLSSMHMS